MSSLHGSQHLDWLTWFFFFCAINPSNLSYATKKRTRQTHGAPQHVGTDTPGSTRTQGIYQTRSNTPPHPHTSNTTYSSCSPYLRRRRRHAPGPPALPPLPAAAGAVAAAAPSPVGKGARRVGKVRRGDTEVALRPDSHPREASCGTGGGDAVRTSAIFRFGRSAGRVGAARLEISSHLRV